MRRENVWYRAVRIGDITLFHAVQDGHETLIRTDYTVCQCRTYALAGGFVLESVRYEDRMPVFEWRHPERSIIPAA